MQEDTSSSPAVTSPVVTVQRAGHPATPSRRRRSVVLAVSLAVVLALSAALLAQPYADTRSGSAAQPSPGAQPPLSSQEIARRDAVVGATLRKRAAAVLHRDRRAWFADVDRRDRRFVRAQQRVFDNLTQIEFASWSYEVIREGYERPELVRKYGNARIYLPPLVLRYAIRGYDAKPVAVPIVLTFVQRGGDWQIASDSDVDADLPEGGHAEPWDRRAIVVGEGRHVLVLADTEDRDELGDLVAAGDQAVRRVAAMWPKRWRKKVVVSAVRDRRLIETYFRSELQSSENVAAIAIPTYTEVTNWVNELPPGAQPERASYRVILNPRYFDPDNDFNLDLLTHEIAHVATGDDSWAGAPTWLVEGAAEYTAYGGGVTVDTDELPASLVRQVRKGEVYLPDYDFFQGDVDANYAVGYLACRFIADRYGEAMLRRLYLRLGHVEREIHTLEEQDKVFRALLGVSTAQFQRRLAAYIKRGT